MNLKQKNAIAAATQDLLTHHLNSFGDFPVPMSVGADPLQPSMPMDRAWAGAIFCEFLLDLGVNTLLSVAMHGLVKGRPKC
jgi:hypothetical protein